MMNENGFDSPAALGAWLRARGIDTSRWGTNNAKTVEDLWSELAAGESQLQAEPLLRVVKVVNLDVVQGNRRLIETAQEMEDGRVRLRRYPPAEKMKPNETPTDAALRCLREELQIAGDYVLDAPAVTDLKTVVEDSRSYPGLSSRYVMYRVKVHVDCLPRTEFTTDDAAQTDGDPVVRHHWDWETARSAVD